MSPPPCGLRAWVPGNATCRALRTLLLGRLPGNQKPDSPPQTQTTLSRSQRCVTMSHVTSILWLFKSKRHLGVSASVSGF